MIFQNGARVQNNEETVQFRLKNMKKLRLGEAGTLQNRNKQIRKW